MPAFLVTILNILGITATAAPILEKILAGIGTYLSTAFTSIFGASASQELDSLVTEGENIIAAVGNDAPAAIAFVKNTYADLEALLAAEPWLAKLLYGTNLIQQASPTPLPRGALNKVNEVAHSNVTAAPAKLAALKASFKKK